MKLIFEQSHPGHRSQFLPASDVPAAALPEELARESALDLPELTEGELARHYEALAQQVHGVNKGFYPLGSCTMKYNPRIDEDVAALPGFTGVHPLQSETHVARLPRGAASGRGTPDRHHRHGPHDLPARRGRARGVHGPAAHQGVP